MSTILKKLRSLPMLGLVAAAAVLSMAMGCGGSANGNASPGNVVAIDLAGTIATPAPGEPQSEFVATVGFNIVNRSSAPISGAEFFGMNDTGTALIQTSKSFNPFVNPGQSVAVIASVKVSRTASSSAGGTTQVSYSSTTSSISVVLISTAGGNRSFTISVTTDPTTGKVSVSDVTTSIIYTGNN